MKYIGLIWIFCGFYAVIAQNPDPVKNKKTYTDFIQAINPDMKYKDLVKTFGEPDKNIGSGIDMYVYRLGDSSKVIVGYSDKILYVEYVTSDKKIPNRIEMNSKKMNYEYFKENLKKDMKYGDIVSVFGIPHGNKGSGIDIYQYILHDKTKIWIGYTADKILYAKHLDKKDEVLHVLFD